MTSVQGVSEPQTPLPPAVSFSSVYHEELDCIEVQLQELNKRRERVLRLIAYERAVQERTSKPRAFRPILLRGGRVILRSKRTFTTLSAVTSA